MVELSIAMRMLATFSGFARRLKAVEPLAKIR
jgi:hypothetical protein